MTKVNLVLLIAGVALQCILLAVMVQRGLARRMPFFVGLIAFYCVRSVGMGALGHSLQGTSSLAALNGLAVVDVVLQCVVAWELFSGAMRAESGTLAQGGWAASVRSSGGRLGVFFLLVIAAGVFAAACGAELPAAPRVPVDRGVLFTGMLFLLVFLACRAVQTPMLLRRIGMGFAAFAVVSLVCQVGLAFAAAARDAASFSRWSYVGPVCYLVVVVWWILVLPRAEVAA